MSEPRDGRDRSGGLVMKGTPHRHMKIAQEYARDGHYSSAYAELQTACDLWRDIWLTASGIPPVRVQNADMLEVDQMVRMTTLLASYQEVQGLIGTASGTRMESTLEQALVIAQKMRLAVAIAEDNASAKLVRHRNPQP